MLRLTKVIVGVGAVLCIMIGVTVVWFVQSHSMTAREAAMRNIGSIEEGKRQWDQTNSTSKP